MHLFLPQHYETRNHHKKKSGKAISTWSLNNMLLNKEWVNQEIKEEIRKYMKINESGNATIQNLWNEGKVVKTGKYVAIQAYHNKQKKISNKQPNLTLYGMRKRTTNKT